MSLPDNDLFWKIKNLISPFPLSFLLRTKHHEITAEGTIQMGHGGALMGSRGFSSFNFLFGNNVDLTGKITIVQTLFNQ